MTLSTGIGGGIWSQGNVWRGADSYAGEIGHLTIRPDGPQCLCGAHGCFERMCCGLWLERDHGKTAKELIERSGIRATATWWISRSGLKACIMLLNPARIVIGGGIGKAGDALFEPLRAELRSRITDWSARAHRRGAGATGRRQRALRRAGAGRNTEIYMNFPEATRPNC